MRNLLSRRPGSVALALATLCAGFSCSSDAPQTGTTGEKGPTVGKQILAGAHCFEHPATCPGAPRPNVKLVNKHPSAPGFEQGKAYALADLPLGKPTLVALLQGW